MTKTIQFTRHALDKMQALRLSRYDVKKALEFGDVQSEGITKFKAVWKRSRACLIVVCDEYPDCVLVITVIRRRGRFH